LASSFDADLDTMLLDDDGLAEAPNNPRKAEVQSPIEYMIREHRVDSSDQALRSSDKHLPTAKEVATEIARDAVFQTNELLENILIHLPARTIFGVQRVSKSFRSAIEDSVRVQKKIFRRKRQDPQTKVMVYDVQHIAALLNPLFVVGAIPGDRTVQDKPLARREGACEKYGITMRHECRIPMTSSILDTYLMHVPFRKLKLSLRFWVGNDGPTMIIDDADVGDGNDMTIRAMIQSVMVKDQKLGVAYDESMWRGQSDRYPTAGVPAPCHRRKRDWYFKQDTREWVHADIVSQKWWAERRAERRRLIVQLDPDEVVESLHAAKAVGEEETWGCDVCGKPGEILRDLQQAADRGSEVNVSLSQRPTFFLHDVVIPATSDWVAIMAKSS
jgi:hypothetical protein